MVDVGDEHLHSDKDENEGKPIVLVVKESHDSRHGEVEGTKSQYGQDIGSVDDERVLSYGKDGGNGVYGEDDIGSFYH